MTKNLWSFLLAWASIGCTSAEPERLAPPQVEARQGSALPEAMRACEGCHAAIVQSYSREHGMARSLGPMAAVTPAQVANPRNGRRYEVTREGEVDEVDEVGEVRETGEAAWLTTIEPGGGRRRQRLVGTIGAGILARSWVTAEIDGARGVPTQRLFFAPLETIGDQWVLAPFEEHDGAPGPDMELTAGCLTCHTTDSLHELLGAAATGNTVYPANALGFEAFEHLRAIGCDGCHGDPALHLEAMGGRDSMVGTGLLSIDGLPPAAQLDICGRCHLQGDSRWELERGERISGPRLSPPLPALMPTLVGAVASDDFRFVGQLERLALSECFQQSPAMTCTSCHDPHRGVTGQGVASLDARCQACHQTRACSRPTGLAVAEVIGGPARSAAGCVDCHVRRSQPFDLTHVRSADHWVRRRIPPPESGLAHRQFTDRTGPLELFGRERIADLLAKPGGVTWERAVRGMGLATMGRFEEARAEFDRLPAAGSAEAVIAASPRPLMPVLDRPGLHRTRGLVLLAGGDLDGALAAFGDALALDPLDPAARLARARVRLDLGEIPGVLEDTQMVIENYPRAEQPWRLRVELAERAGRPDLALAGLEALTARWPSDATSWQKLGLLLRQRGELDRAAAALARSESLDPTLDLARP